MTHNTRKGSKYNWDQGPKVLMLKRYRTIEAVSSSTWKVKVVGKMMDQWLWRLHKSNGREPSYHILSNFYITALNLLKFSTPDSWANLLNCFRGEYCLIHRKYWWDLLCYPFSFRSKRISFIPPYTYFFCHFIFISLAAELNSRIIMVQNLFFRLQMNIGTFKNTS